MDDSTIDLFALAKPFLPIPQINHEQLVYIGSLCQQVGRKAIEEVQTGRLKVEILNACAAAFESGLDGGVSTFVHTSSPLPSYLYRYWTRRKFAFLSQPGCSEAATLLCAMYFLLQLRNALGRPRPVAIVQDQVRQTKIDIIGPDQKLTDCEGCYYSRRYCRGQTHQRE